MNIRCINVRSSLTQTAKLVAQRYLSSSPFYCVSHVKQLTDWDLDTFKENAFNTGRPVKLPFNDGSLLPACRKWFVHKNSPSLDTKLDPTNPPKSSELRTSFWSEHETTIVPLELTTRPQPLISRSSDTGTSSTQFHRTSAPLKILLTYLSNPVSPTSSTSLEQDHSIYLAQCDLNSLPSSLRSDVPTPQLVTSSGKGDIYSSSLWMGRPPTYTPLHRDPNPNLFLQLAGQKVVRLLPPEVGDAVFEEVQERLAASGSSSASFRGEEMMAGPEKELLHRIIWEDDSSDEGNQGVLAYACEARLELGQALFIPKGWWHSVKGVGEGVTASVNWWFR